MNALMIQTSDSRRYSRMLAITEPLNRLYCMRQDVRYASFIGICRGSHPWQATLNRIDMLANLLKAGQVGWVAYLDADSWICDFSFDLQKYLDEKAEFAGVFVRSGATNNRWDVNAGVFFLNLDHVDARHLINEWEARLERAWPIIQDLTEWPKDGQPDDQSMLHEVINDDRLQSTIFFERKSLINSNYATFIRQLLRSETSSFEDRIERIRVEVAQILFRLDDETTRLYSNDMNTASNIVNGIFKELLGRSPGTEPMKDYSELVVRLGVENGIRAVVGIVAGSEEFRRRIG